MITEALGEHFGTCRRHPRPRAVGDVRPGRPQGRRRGDDALADVFRGDLCGEYDAARRRTAARRLRRAWPPAWRTTGGTCAPLGGGGATVLPLTRTSERAARRREATTPPPRRSDRPPHDHACACAAPQGRRRSAARSLSAADVAASYPPRTGAAGGSAASSITGIGTLKRTPARGGPAQARPGSAACAAGAPWTQRVGTERCRTARHAAALVRSNGSPQRSHSCWPGAAAGGRYRFGRRRSSPRAIPRPSWPPPPAMAASWAPSVFVAGRARSTWISFFRN